MPAFELQISAQLENLTQLKPEGDDFRWYMRLKCSSCGEGCETHHYITESETQPLKGGRGEANLVIKCKFCSRENSISVVPKSRSSYNAEDSGSFKSIVQFECRGVEPYDFDFRMGWCASATESTTHFKNINLTDKEWTEYDEKGKACVSIMELDSAFIKSHK